MCSLHLKMLDVSHLIKAKENNDNVSFVPDMATWENPRYGRVVE